MKNIQCEFWKPHKELPGVELSKCAEYSGIDIQKKSLLGKGKKI